MVKLVHTIDPRADTVIILKNALQDSAIWKRPAIERLNAGDSAPSADPATEVLSKEKSVTKPSQEEDSNEEVVQYNVFSTYLKLASPHFERMLSAGRWKEGIPNEVDGRYHVSVEDWDQEALLIVLNALHRRTREVPRSISIERLARISTIIEYYNCMEGIELLLGELWIDNLKKSSPVPSTSCRDLLRWMYIAWVFQLSEEFTRTTEIASRQCTHGDLTSSDLPIERFIVKISQARVQAISTVVSGLNLLLGRFRSTKYRCLEGDYALECGAMQHGALAKQMESLGLIPSSLKPPFPRFSVEKICSDVNTIKFPYFHTHTSGSATTRDCVTHGRCNLIKTIKGLTDVAQNSIKGLQLTEFARM